MFGLPSDIYVVLQEGPTLEPLLQENEAFVARLRQRAPETGDRRQLDAAAVPGAARPTTGARLRAEAPPTSAILASLTTASAAAGFRPGAFQPFIDRLPTDAVARTGADFRRLPAARTRRSPRALRRARRRRMDARELRVSVERRRGGSPSPDGRRGYPRPALHRPDARQPRAGRRVRPAVRTRARSSDRSSSSDADRAVVSRLAAVCCSPTLPTAIGLIWTAGLLALAGVSLDLFAVFAVVTFVGIGIDYGIHLVHRYQHEGDATTAIAQLAPVIVVAGVITLFGYGTLITSSYPPLQSMGIVSVVSVVALVPRPCSCCRRSSRWSTIGRADASAPMILRRRTDPGVQRGGQHRSGRPGHQPVRSQRDRCRRRIDGWNGSSGTSVGGRRDREAAERRQGGGHPDRSAHRPRRSLLARAADGRRPAAPASRRRTSDRCRASGRVRISCSANVNSIDARCLPSRYYANRMGSAILSRFVGTTVRDTQCGFRRVYGGCAAAIVARRERIRDRDGNARQAAARAAAAMRHGSRHRGVRSRQAASCVPSATRRKPAFSRCTIVSWSRDDAAEWTYGDRPETLDASRPEQRRHLQPDLSRRARVCRGVSPTALGRLGSAILAHAHPESTDALVDNLRAVFPDATDEQLRRSCADDVTAAIRGTSSISCAPWSRIRTGEELFEYDDDASERVRRLHAAGPRRDAGQRPLRQLGGGRRAAVAPSRSCR